MITAADGSDFTTAVTVAVTIDNGTQTAGGSVVHEGNGYHSYEPSQAETNGDHLTFTFSAVGAISVSVQVFTTFPQTVDNATGISSNGSAIAALIAPDNAGIAANGVAIAALPDAAANALAVLETQLNEAYVGEGVPPTLTQAVMIMHQLLQQFAYVGATNTVKALDKTTTIAIYDNLDAANPTSSNRIF